jgi:hypothetical protein
MYSTLEGTVTYIEEKSIKRDGKPEEHYRTVTVLQSPGGSKPELLDVKVLNGNKIEMGQKVKWPVRSMAYLKRDREGNAQGAGLSVTVIEADQRG